MADDDVSRLSLLNLNDASLGLADLLTKRLATLSLSAVGKGYVPVLSAKQKAIDELPPALLGKPLAEELGQVDFEHDGLGRGIWLQTESYMQLPNVPADVLAAAKRIRAAFIPELARLQEPYADQAEAAKSRAAAIGTLEADLKKFPLASGQTLYDWAVAFNASGEKLSALLSKRGDVDTKARKAASKLRSEAVGLLNRVRAAVADEVAANPALPRDLDAQIFGYFDVLEAQRKAVNAANKAPEVEAPGGDGKSDGEGPKAG
jgi:hypothetical protein